MPPPEPCIRWLCGRFSVRADISDNIAEGAERRGKTEFKQFLGYAKGSAGEARSQVLRALALGYMPAETGRELAAELREISRMIHGLIDSLER